MTPSTRCTPARTALVGLTGLVLVLAGCGSDDSSRAADRPTSASSPASPPTASGGNPPTIEPADGHRIELAALSARTVRGFDHDTSLAKEVVFSSSRDLRQQLTFSDVTVYPGTTNATAARLTAKNSSWRRRPRTASPVTMDGARWYHLTGPVGDGTYLEDYGTVHDSRLVRISFELTGPPSKRLAIVSSVLATVRLR
ncbi:MAG TPA: hypothetical protein VFM08_08705 [Nocardioides sp.]|nr:hypothetical protein [Nocardioides sp.]